MSSDHQHRKTFCVSVCGVGTRQQAGLPRRPTTTLHPPPRLRPRRATSTMTASWNVLPLVLDYPLGL